MNGIQLIGMASFDQLSASLQGNEPYVEDGSACIDLVCNTADITLIYLDSETIVKDDVLVLLNEVIALDEKVSLLKHTAEGFSERGTEYHISYVEIESKNEVALFYCGVSVNEQWGVEFSKNGAGEWEFNGYC